MLLQDLSWSKLVLEQSLLHSYQNYPVMHTAQRFPFQV